MLSHWAGILPISFGSPPVHNTKLSPRSGAMETIFLPDAESDTFNLEDGVIQSDSRSFGTSRPSEYLSGDFPIGRVCVL
jgi:hypothetical protein